MTRIPTSIESLRTPDERFAGLPGYAFAPHYVEVARGDGTDATLRMHHLDEGPADGEVVYVGDGISDRCAAQAAGRVFATRGLARYFDERNLPYEPFGDFHDVVRALTG